MKKLHKIIYIIFIIWTIFFFSWKEISIPNIIDSISIWKDSIKLITPNGGETYWIGDIMLISSSGWRRSDVGWVENSYFLVDNKGKEKSITTTGNIYKWKILSTGDWEAIMPWTYKIKVTSSYWPCNSKECLQTITDYSDKEFTLIQKDNSIIPGTLEGTVKFTNKARNHKTLLSINTREEKPDKYRGLNYTLQSIGIKRPEEDGTFSMKLYPGIYWVEDTHHDGYEIKWLPWFITIKSGEVTKLDYIIGNE